MLNKNVEYAVETVPGFYIYICVYDTYKHIDLYIETFEK